MSLLTWILLGLISGYVASKVVNHRGEGIILDVVLGILGAFVGGWLFHKFGEAGVTGLNLWSMLVAVVGSIATLIVFHLVRRIVA